MRDFLKKIAMDLQPIATIDLMVSPSPGGTYQQYKLLY